MCIRDRVHTPQKVREGTVDKVPVVFFYHGGSDNPSEAAEMSRFHEIGEEAGFITVYPWGSNRAGWNMELLPDGEDDLSYCNCLLYTSSRNGKRQNAMNWILREMKES